MIGPPIAGGDHGQFVAVFAGYLAPEQYQAFAFAVAGFGALLPANERCSGHIDGIGGALDRVPTAQHLSDHPEPVDALWP